MFPRGRFTVNDVHSQLNATVVDQIVQVDSLKALQKALESARWQNKAVCVAGQRHAMGGQQFGTGAILIDTTAMQRVLGFDPGRGVVEVEAGIQWPALIAELAKRQTNRAQPWAIAQKQTGADGFSLAGTMAANSHGRGLAMRPIIADIESFVLVDAWGRSRTCSRRQNQELFRLAIGGYGLFGVIYSLKLRLVPRQKVERVVELIDIAQLPAAFDERLAAGYLYGDFQFCPDEQSKRFLREGILACYRPVPLETKIPPDQLALTEADWAELLYLGHADKAAAYQQYVDHYLATSGQIYHSDTQQLSVYIENYHEAVDQRMEIDRRATEVITELYVPRERLIDFMAAVRADFLANEVNLIYGTVRLIERDTESFLTWARQSYACVVFNLHTVHTPQGLAHSAAAFRRLIDLAIQRQGSYFLTYHKYATRPQLLACYPQFPDFLRQKLTHDPEERFQSDWYRHYKRMFADLL